MITVVDGAGGAIAGRAGFVLIVASHLPPGKATPNSNAKAAMTSSSALEIGPASCRSAPLLGNATLRLNGATSTFTFTG